MVTRCLTAGASAAAPADIHRFNVDAGGSRGCTCTQRAIAATGTPHKGQSGQAHQPLESMAAFEKLDHWMSQHHNHNIKSVPPIANRQAHGLRRSNGEELGTHYESKPAHSIRMGGYWRGGLTGQQGAKMACCGSPKETSSAPKQCKIHDDHCRQPTETARKMEISDESDKTALFSRQRGALSMGRPN
ncbi:hypothetical protein G7046_g5321 [Stylonectria norvegica]|nr:hypothetical protein G7046_g5321 [Stylonectria norvegica]